MTKIKKYVDHIDEELKGAGEYAEKYIEHKARGENTEANEYKQMAQDELKHSQYLHAMAVKEIEQIKKVYTAPADMQKAWDDMHAFYVREYERIKGMVS